MGNSHHNAIRAWLTDGRAADAPAAEPSPERGEPGFGKDSKSLTPKAARESARRLSGGSGGGGGCCCGGGGGADSGVSGSGGSEDIAGSDSSEKRGKVLPAEVLAASIRRLSCPILRHMYVSSPRPSPGAMVAGARVTAMVEEVRATEASYRFGDPNDLKSIAVGGGGYGGGGGGGGEGGEGGEGDEAA